MTHTTGPRKNMVDGLAKVFLLDIDVAKASITESIEALHEANMALAHLMLRPWEKETCPTCPKEMKERGDEILKEPEMTGIEDELLDVDSNMKQPDVGLTRERRAAIELRRRGDEIRHLRGGLVTIAALCPFPPYPDKLSTRMAEIAKKTLKDEVQR